MSTTIHDADPSKLETAQQPKATKRLKKTASALAEKAQDAAVEKSDAVRASADNMLSDVQDSVNVATDRAREVTMQQPLLVVAGALSIGIVLGMAIKTNR